MPDDYFRDGGGFRFDIKHVMLGGPISEQYHVSDKLWHVVQEMPRGRRFEGVGDSHVAAVLDLIAQKMEAFPPHRPHRGSDVEAWLKTKRDEYIGSPEEGYTLSWAALDTLLDEYRLRADTGATLSTPAEEIGPHAEGPSGHA